jgi:hypothetical protein
MPRAATDSFPGGANPPWEAGLPELDPRLRNREPGPGMPGYRPSSRRGSDPYASDPYAQHLHSADEASTQYGGDPYQSVDGYGRDGQEPEFYSQDGYGWDGAR